jgi:regulator of replication initiation timing
MEEMMETTNDDKLDHAIKELSDLCDRLIKENGELKIENVNLKLRISILTGEEFKC